MNIWDGMIRDYLAGRDLAGYREMWYFADSFIAREAGRNLFEAPGGTAEERQKVETVWVMLKKVEWRSSASRCFSGVLQYRSSAGASVKIMPTACILTCPPTRPAIWKKERQ